MNTSKDETINRSNVQEALNFIAELRKDLSENPSLRTQFRQLSLQRLAALANSRGFKVSVENLRNAHVVDWRMRYQRLNRVK